MTRFLRNVSICAALVLSFGNTAVAGGLVGFDLGVHGGATGASDSETNNFIGGVQARLHLITFLGVELRGSGFKTTYTGPAQQSAELKTYPIQGSVMVYLLPLPKFSLYALGGGGYQNYDFDYRSPVTGGSVSVSGGQWAAHAGAGFDLKVSKSFIINVDARYVFLDVNELTQITGKDFDYWAATVGLNWRLF